MGSYLLKQHLSVDNLAKAIFTVNRHAKAALEPQHLYKIKKLAIEKLLQEQKADKVGLHFSDNPKFSNQHSTLLVKVADYYFHLPPSKEDFERLDHLGELDEHYRNPKTQMSLSYAKKLIYQYINWQEPKQKAYQKRYSSYYTPSSLGKMEWPPTKKFYK